MPIIRPKKQTRRIAVRMIADVAMIVVPFRFFVGRVADMANKKSVPRKTEDGCYSVVPPHFIAFSQMRPLRDTSISLRDHGRPRTYLTHACFRQSARGMYSFHTTSPSRSGRRLSVQDLYETTCFRSSLYVVIIAFFFPFVKRISENKTIFFGGKEQQTQ